MASIGKLPEGEIRSVSSSSSALQAIGRSSPVGSHTISAVFASGVSTSCFYPFDVIRTRFMSQDGTLTRRHNGRTYHSIRESLLTMYRKEGQASLFKGFLPAVFGSVGAWGLYMYFYRSLCNWAENTSYIGRSGLSVVASLASTSLVSPIFLIKSRMQLEEASCSRSSFGVASHTSAKDHRVYKSFFKGVKHVLSTDGVRGLWKGLSLQMLLVFPYCLNVPTYDFFKAIILNYHVRRTECLPPFSLEQNGTGNVATVLPESSRCCPSLSSRSTLSIFEIACCSCLTKVFLILLSQPLMVLRVRVQDQRALQGPVQYKNVAQSLITVLRQQGVLGMYRGFAASCIHSLPRSALYYILYESSLTFLINA